MAYSESQWQMVQSYYEAGLSLSEIIARDNVDIKSKSQISKRANKFGWIKSDEKKQLIFSEVKAKQQLSAIKKQKETILKETTDIIAHNDLVSERLNHEQFFTNAAIRNVQESLQVPCESQQDFKYRAETIQKGRETVLGKSPDSAVQINNNNNNGPMTLADFYGNSDNTNA